MANYSCKKFFPYALKLSHNASVTRGETDGQRVDDNQKNLVPQIRPLADITHFKYAPTYLLTYHANSSTVT